MKNKYLSAFLRLAFYGAGLLGLLMLLASLQSFETMAAILNRPASDGRLESFTVERFHSLRIPFGAIGVGLALLSGFALIRWAGTLSFFDFLFDHIKEWNSLFRQDTRIFFQDVRRVFVHLTRTDALMLCGLIFAAIIVRLDHLFAPLIADEAYTYNAFASGSLWVTISDYHLPNNHVLLSIMVNILTHLFGNHIWLMRLPTIIVGVLMVPAGYLYGKQNYGRNVGLIGAALITVTPILVRYSVWARGYGIVSWITLLILILGDYVRRHTNRFAWFLMALLSAAGFYTVPIMLFPFGALYLWLFLSGMIGDTESYPSRLDFIKYWLVSGFASALLTVLLYAPILLNDSDRFFHNQFITPVGWDALPSALLSSAQDTWIQWTSSVPGWGVVLGMVGFAAAFLLHRKISRPKVPWQLAFLIWIGILVLIRRPDMGARLWLFLLSPVLIWSAGGIVGSLEWLSGMLGRKLYLGEIAAGIAVVSVVLFSLSLIPTLPARWSEKGSIEKTVLYLKDHLRDGDLVNASTNSLSVIRYYFNIHDVPLDYVRRSGPFERAFIAVSRETDTLESLSPVDGSNRPLINFDTARIILDLDGLTVYECYPAP